MPIALVPLARPRSSNPPVGLLDKGLELGVNALLGLLHALQGALHAAASLGKTVTHGLRQVKVAGLIDEVEAGLLGLPVIKQVHGCGSSAGALGSSQGNGSQEAGQDLYEFWL